jgi:hypothetical protein
LAGTRGVATVTVRVVAVEDVPARPASAPVALLQAGSPLFDVDVVAGMAPAATSVVGLVDGAAAPPRG